VYFFRSFLSDKFPENGRKINVEIEKRLIINPLLSSPQRFVMNGFSSGRIKLNPAMKKNIEKERSQKFLSYFIQVAKMTNINQ